MHLKKSEKEIVKNILNSIIPTIKVAAFGSRVSGKNLKQFSDLDLAIMAPQKLSMDIILKLQEEFSESDLPFMVDIVDYNTVGEVFKKAIDENCEVIN
jgi:uncharacterized protein